MPGALKQPRRDAAAGLRPWPYAAYAVGEVALIFLGITLAVALENSNDRRRTAELERQVLVSIQENLKADLQEIARNIDRDESVVRYAEIVLAHLASQPQWHDSLNASLGQAFFWSGPFFSTSGFENLKQLGLHLVSEPEIRDQLVHLYENTYALLVGDTERGQWVFQESVLFPVLIDELDPVDPTGVHEVGSRSFRVRDYQETVRRRTLVAALAEHRFRVLDGLGHRAQVRQEIEALLSSLEEYLDPE